MYGATRSVIYSDLCHRMTELDKDAHYLRRTLTLAACGAAAVAPNPVVGCVIVGAAGNILAEGYHRRYGGPHAEVEAVQTLAPGQSLAGATVYVSLEPCAHQGKTPPCADLLARLQPARVVAAVQDPNPLVAGQGFARLRQAGLAVQVGPLSAQALVQNRRFIGRFWQGRPFVTLKWAQTADGYLARADYTSQWITGPQARMQAHRLRARHQAIAVGYRTALHDDPRLDTRLWPGPSPVRIVVDPHRALPGHLQLFTDDGPTLHLYTGAEDALPFSTPCQGYQAISVNPGGPGGWPGAVLRTMHRANLHSLLVEGGAGLLNAFQQANLWDEAAVFTGPCLFGPDGVAAPKVALGAPLTTLPLGPDTLSVFGNPTLGFWPSLTANQGPAALGAVEHLLD